MRKKEKIAAAAVFVMVAVIVLAAVAVDKERERRHAEALVESETQRAGEQAARTYSQDEVVRISSDDKDALAFTCMQGSMEMSVLDAGLYGSYEATGLPTCDGHFFGLPGAAESDSCYYLVAKVVLKNINAQPLNETKSGKAEFIFGGPEANAAEFVYFDGSPENSPEGTVNCFSIEQGEEETYTACWQIPQNDGWSNLPASVTFEMFGYLVELAPRDCR